MSSSPPHVDPWEWQRAQDEYTLVDIAIRLDAAIRVYKDRKGIVNLDVFLDKMDEELVRNESSSDVLHRSYRHCRLLWTPCSTHIRRTPPSQ